MDRCCDRCRSIGRFQRYSLCRCNIDADRAREKDQWEACMSIFDLIAGMLFFNFITFGLYLAVVLICIDRRRQRQQIVDQHINRQNNLKQKEEAHERKSHQRESSNDHDAALSAQGRAGRQEYHRDRSRRATRAAMHSCGRHDRAAAVGCRMSIEGTQ